MSGEVSSWLGNGTDRFELNAWTPLLYKNVLATRYKTGIDWMAPSWMGGHRPRIQAYTALAAYRENAARLLLQITNDEEREARDQRREYGDASLLVEQIRSSLMGDQQSIVVAGADDYDPNKPQDEDQVQALAAVERQEFLQTWGEDERLTTKLIETERNAVSMGDGVYSLGWDSRTERVALRTWDPGAYFPVLDGNSDPNGYPSRIHIAWQILDDDTNASEIKIRRITFDLRDVPPYKVKWEGKLVTKSCFLTDATFLLDSDSRNPDDLTFRTAVFEEDALGPVDDRDLGIDFIPVIHVPNTVAIDNHFGQSSIAKVLQIIDDVQATDSDLQASSALTGNPTLVIKGGQTNGQLAVGPGLAIDVPKDGGVDVVSGAEGLTPLEKYRDNLLRRLSTNARVPEAVLGRVDPSKVAAGIVLSLSFGPLSSLIDGEMRPVRKDKYRLMLKFVQRFYLKQGVLDGEVFPADLVFGSYLPSDQAGTVEMVRKLLTPPAAISVETAIKMLVEAGIPIDDVAEEIRRINSRDFEGATKLLDATGNDNAVTDYLGVESTRPDPVTVVQPAQVDEPTKPEEEFPQEQ